MTVKSRNRALAVDELLREAAALPPGAELTWPIPGGWGSRRRALGALNALLRDAGLMPIPVAPRSRSLRALRPLDLSDANLGPKDLLLLDALKAHGAVTFRAQGGSMRPLLPDGTKVRVALRRPPWAPAAGRIVLLAQPGRTVLHRLRRRTATAHGPAFLARGDGTCRWDVPVWRNAILGVLVAIHEDRGRAGSAEPSIGGARGA